MNDLDTPRAIQRLRAIERDISMSDEMKRAIFLYADQVLALGLDVDKSVVVLPENCEALLAQREVARSSKDWARSDALRDELAAFLLATLPKVKNGNTSKALEQLLQKLQ